MDQVDDYSSNLQMMEEQEEPIIVELDTTSLADRGGEIEKAASEVNVYLGTCWQDIVAYDHELLAPFIDITRRLERWGRAFSNGVLGSQDWCLVQYERHSDELASLLQSFSTGRSGDDAARTIRYLADKMIKQRTRLCKELDDRLEEYDDLLKEFDGRVQGPLRFRMDRQNDERTSLLMPTRRTVASRNIVDGSTALDTIKRNVHLLRSRWLEHAKVTERMILDLLEPCRSTSARLDKVVQPASHSTELVRSDHYYTLSSHLDTWPSDIVDAYRRAFNQILAIQDFPDTIPEPAVPSSSFGWITMPHQIHAAIAKVFRMRRTPLNVEAKANLDQTSDANPLQSLITDDDLSHQTNANQATSLSTRAPGNTDCLIASQGWSTGTWAMIASGLCASLRLVYKIGRSRPGDRQSFKPTS